MTPKRKAPKPVQDSSIQAHISGSVNGQIAIGNNINQTQHTQYGSSSLSDYDLQILQDLFTDLKNQIGSIVPIDKQATALEKTIELEEAIASEQPDVTTIEYVRNWFVKNVPQLAGTVTGLVVNPIVGKLVEAAGETVAHEFKRRFKTE